jgi:hypothetical protein
VLRKSSKGSSVARFAANPAFKDYELSGRLLRRIPMLAHARYISKNGDMNGRPRRVDTWLDAMGRVIEDEVRSKLSIAGAVVAKNADITG